MKTWYLFCPLFLAVACQSNSTLAPATGAVMPDNTAPMITRGVSLADSAFCGTWTYQDYDPAATALVYRRTPNLLPNKFGIRLLANGRFTDRRNSGFCLTDPMPTEDLDGVWQQRGDSLAVVTTYFGTKIESRIFIISADSTTLRFRRVSR